jgi:uncharacterized protein (TIGR03083 family)
MDADKHLDQLRLEGQRFGDAVRSCTGSTVVRACPGFDLAELTWHLAVVHNFWSTVVAEGLTSPDVALPIRPEPSRVVDLYDTTFHRLVDVLARADMNARVWTPSTQHDVRYALRRAAQETAVHRWDAQSAADPDAADPIDAQLAQDGIDEWVTFILRAPPHARIDLVVPDGPAWTLGVGPVPEATVHGDSSRLLLALWRRVPVSSLHIEGDVRAATAFLETADIG